MNILQRVLSIVLAIILAAAGVILLMVDQLGIYIVAVMLCAVLVIIGIRSLMYYFSMARHKVGGRTLLYTAVIILDMGIFMLYLADAPTIYVVLYLFGTHAFAGLVNILRALEAKKYNAAHWRLKLTYGIVNIAVGVACVIFVKYIEISVFVFALGLFYSALMRIINAFRKTSVVYIQ